jgi:guanylate kinase
VSDEAISKNREGFVIVVSSPSGGGKTTIVTQILDQLEGIERSISYTTREIRPGEVDGKDYIFVSMDDFKEDISEDMFLEWEEVFDNYYGTSEKQVRRLLAQGKDVVLSIDVKGALKVKNKFPGSIGIFIMPPSKEETIKRLQQRQSEGEEQLQLRLKEYEKEMARSDEYDYMVINDMLEEAVNEVKTIIEKEREQRR